MLLVRVVARAAAELLVLAAREGCWDADDWDGGRFYVWSLFGLVLGGVEFVEIVERFGVVGDGLWYV